MAAIKTNRQIKTNMETTTRQNNKVMMAATDQIKTNMETTTRQNNKVIHDKNKHGNYHKTEQ